MQPYSQPDFNLRKFRKDLPHKPSQLSFWKQIEVGQSVASRYESGREMPPQVAELLRLRIVLGVDTTKITADNAQAVIDLIEHGMIDTKLHQARAELQQLESRLSAAKSALRTAA